MTQQALAIQHLPPKSIDKLWKHLPDYVQTALRAKATDLGCPLEAVLEMAIASFLDTEAFSFEDCLLAQRLKDNT
jgi:hypothetical protein